jgi:acetyl/propionyl-CoA carboxylase alpha subunit
MNATKYQQIPCFCCPTHPDVSPLNQISARLAKFVASNAYFYTSFMTNKEFKAKVNGESEYTIVLNDEGHTGGTINGENAVVDLLQDGGTRFHVLRDNKSYNVEILDADVEAKTMLVKVNGRDYEVAITDRYDELLKSLGMDSTKSSKVNELKAPMPGLVLDVRVSEGQAVSKGDPIIVLEAMKMENILKSPADVVIRKIIAKKGNAVEKNQVLVTFE